MFKTALPLIIAAGALLAGCATVPEPLTGQFSQVTLQDAGNAAGSEVRWGGEIIETVPAADHTCIYALSRPLDRSARPQPEKESMGRFVACHAGFYDPEIFAKGREITVTGSVDGSITRKVGDYPYPYPRVAADNIYLWPVKAAIRHTPMGMYGPYWGPGYWDPFWYRPSPVIIIRNPPPDSGGK